MHYIMDKSKYIDKSKSKNKTYFLTYTLLFILMFFLVFIWHIAARKTFIWKYDGWDQHYKALVYYGKYLRSIIQNLLFHQQLIIPLWDFAIGEGSDIIQTLHYYVIGDPFTVLSVLVPVRFMHFYYDAIIILRLYLSGIAFSFLCFQTGKRNKYAVMAGAMTYAFCYWAIYNAARHPYFLNPMLYLPMLIIGIEKILKRQRPYLFIFTVFLSAISNFYFFYMLVLVTIIYVIVRAFTLYSHNFKMTIQIVLKIGAASVVGLMLSAIIFLPICYTFLNDTRLSVGNKFHLFYPLSYYSRLPAEFLIGENIYWECMGYAAPAVLAVFLLFRKHHKEYTLLKVLFISSIVTLCIPALGQIFNGFSYMANRWCWAFALLIAYILTSMWPVLMRLHLKDYMALFSYITIYFMLCMFLEYSRTIKSFVAIIFAFVFLFLLLPIKDEKGFFFQKKRQQLALIVVLISIVCNSFWLNSSAGSNYASESLEAQGIYESLNNNETNAITYAAESDHINTFYRYSGRSLTQNANLLSGLSSTQYFWSLVNPYVQNFRISTEQVENIITNYKGYDERSALNALSSVLYYVTPSYDSAPVPYGFTYTDTISDYAIYQNEIALPLSYSYDGVISTDTWNTYSSVEKQEALLQTLVLNNSDINIDETNPDFISKEIAYTLSCNDNGISLLDNTFVVTSANSTVTLLFDGLTNCETYFRIKGLSFEGVPVYDLYFSDECVDPLNLYNPADWDKLSYADKSSIRKEKLFWTAPTSTSLSLKSSKGISKTLSYYTEDYPWYNDRHDFTVNLNYFEEAISSLTITFSRVGVYNFDSIDIICQPMEHYKDQVSKLKENTLNDINIGINSVIGSITLNEPKFVCMSIPYSKGWSAYVDGKKAKLYQANLMYMALSLDTGEHTIELVYETPLLKEGIFISVFSLLIFVVFIFLSEQKNLKSS